ncbi:organic solute transporter subunit alpha isoform X1 [Lemur catta]|uniref:organic solute transporter subunit alpha isoform X1 n=1 Tax=Lemur catta TaxID=9447 RepID=UPI001E26D053|nr:organic solute transporter subunit alpha isoform X1 [Lemur catta]
MLLAPLQAGSVCVLLLWSLDSSFPHACGNGHNLVSVLGHPQLWAEHPSGISFCSPLTGTAESVSLMPAHHESSPSQLVLIQGSLTSSSVQEMPYFGTFLSHLFIPIAPNFPLPQSSGPVLSCSSWISQPECPVSTIFLSVSPTSPCRLFLWQQSGVPSAGAPTTCSQSHFSPCPRFYAICFYLLMLVMVEGFGGKEAVLRTLKDTPMIVHTGPCCCCCLCCPRLMLTRKKLQLLMLGPFQYAFFKITLVLVGLFLIPDGIYDPADISEKSTALWINTFLGASTLFALWTLGILFRQAKLHLGEQNIGGKFILFQVLVVLTALQPSIFSLLANGGQIACSPPFSSKIRSQVMNCHLLILETFLLTVLTRMYYRREDHKLGYETFSSPDLDLNTKA